MLSLTDAGNGAVRLFASTMHNLSTTGIQHYIQTMCEVEPWGLRLNKGCMTKQQRLNRDINTHGHDSG